MKRWRIGYAAFWLLIFFVPAEILQAFDWLFGRDGVLGHHPLIEIMVMVVGSLPLFVLVVKFRPKLTAFRDYLNTCQLPGLTFARVVVSVGVVTGFCTCFIWLFESVEKLSDPRWLLLMAGITLTVNLLEIRWVASDQRQSAFRLNRKGFA